MFESPNWQERFLAKEQKKKRSNWQKVRIIGVQIKQYKT